MCCFDYFFGTSSTHVVLLFKEKSERTYASDSAKAEGSSIVDEPGEG